MKASQDMTRADLQTEVERLRALAFHPKGHEYRELWRELENAITWGITCLNCSNLLDQLYERDITLEILRERGVDTDVIPK